MLKTKQLHTAIAAGSLLLAALCAATPAFAAVLKIATLSPDGSSWMRIMRAAGDDIEADTGGRVKFKFYPGGVMGSDEAVMRKIRIGQLQGGAMPSGALINVYPDSQIYNLPMKFRNFEEVDYVRARMDEQIIEGFEKGGFVTFGLAEGGFAYIMSKQPISTIADMKAKKVWVPSNDEGALLVVKTFGVNPIPLGLSDVLAALQTGLVDTVASSPIGAIALHWHTQVKYMSNAPVMYFYAVLAIDKKAFGRISEADQAVVRQRMRIAFEEIDTLNRADNRASYDALLKQGIELVELTPAQLKSWSDTAQQAERNMVERGIVSRAALTELDGYLSEFRAAQAK